MTVGQEENLSLLSNLCMLVAI